MNGRTACVQMRRYGQFHSIRTGERLRDAIVEETRHCEFYLQGKERIQKRSVLLAPDRRSTRQMTYPPNTTLQLTASHARDRWHFERDPVQRARGN